MNTKISFALSLSFLLTLDFLYIACTNPKEKSANLSKEAIILLKTNKEQAEDLFTQAYQLDSNNTEASQELARLYRKKNPQQALAFYDKTLLYNDNNILKEERNNLCLQQINNIRKQPLDKINFKTFYSWAYHLNERSKGTIAAEAIAIFELLKILESHPHQPSPVEGLQFIEAKIEDLKFEIDPQNITYIIDGYEMAKAQGNIEIKSSEELRSNYTSIVGQLRGLTELITSGQETNNGSENLEKFFYYTVLSKKLKKYKSSLN